MERSSSARSRRPDVAAAGSERRGHCTARRGRAASVVHPSLAMQRCSGRDWSGSRDAPRRGQTAVLMAAWTSPHRGPPSTLTATAAAEGSPQGAARCTAGSMSSAGSTGSPVPAQSGWRWACALSSRCEPAAGMRWRCWRAWLSARRRGGEGRRAAQEVSRAACPPRAATAPAARERGRATQLARRSVIICCRGLSTRGRSRCGRLREGAAGSYAALGRGDADT